MTRKEARQLFGGNMTLMARECGISTAALYKWPSKGDLPLRHENLVRGAYARYIESRDREAVAVLGKAS